MSEEEIGFDETIKVIRRGGSGAYGSVWQAEQDGRHVAVKIIHENLAHCAPAREHFRSLARVDGHKNVVRVFSLSRVKVPSSETPVLAVVMEWLEGDTLQARLEGDRFTLSGAKQICVDVLNGLQFMHDQGIAHRDLHAKNVIIVPGVGVKIIDIDCSQEYSIAKLSMRSQEAALQGDIQFAALLVLNVVMHSDLALSAARRAEPLFRAATTIDQLVEQVEGLREVQEFVPVQPESCMDFPRQIEEFIETGREQSLRRLLVQETERVAQILTSSEFSPERSEGDDKEQFKTRVERIDAELRELCSGIATLGFWAHEPTRAIETLEHIANCPTEFEKSGGVNWWLELQTYPPLLLMYAAGVGAIAGSRYDFLHELLARPVGRNEHREEERLTGRLWLQKARQGDRWNAILNPDRKLYTPISQHLQAYLPDCLRHLISLDVDMERHFDRFEFLSGAQEYYMTLTKETFQPWGPVGCFIWRRTYHDDALHKRMLTEASEAGEKWPPTVAGLFGGSISQFKEIVVNYQEHIGRVRQQAHMW